MNLLEVSFIVLIVNLPFGYWRANVRRLSLKWFLAIHIPVGLVILIRILSGLGWQLSTVPVLVTAFFVGQLLGTRLHGWWSKRAGAPVTSCLVMDVVRVLRTRY